MQPVALAIVWHQHQPYYPDNVSGENLMPWVRLHGTKDYWGMAWHLKEVPEFRCTINLVPSLVRQLQAYTDHGGSDRHLDVSRMPADGLSEADALYLLDQFFMANADNMIRPYRRYTELFQKRSAATDPATRALKRFTERDYRDLQVWNNLTWMHPILFERDSDLAAFLQKGQNYSEADKAWLLQKQLDVLREVIPLHAELAQRGQVELTCTPFYHPILPLLWDKRSARQAMPGCKLPLHLESYQEDAIHQLRTAVEFHRQTFGVAPVGMWPSEGSVSQEIIAAIADCGIRWIATDEEILAASTNGWVSRDPNGFLRNPEMLYRPWLVEEQGRSLAMVFRDHAMSDLIGFHYQRSDPRAAVDDLLGRVESIGRATQAQGKPALVPIILDGENCWEYYPDGGVQFLRTLYTTAVQRPLLKPTRVCDSLEQSPPTDRIQQLFAGSWISHNFYIWIGHSEDRAAWDLLHETRAFLKDQSNAGAHSPDVLARAWEEIYIAEGSDWFWWFGDDHHSDQDDLFDQLFRKHLKNVYHLLRMPYPPQLDRPISGGVRRPSYTQPKGFLQVKVDGRRTYFEWIDAARYVAGNERGTMTLTTHGLMREVFFGFDRERFLMRIDTTGTARDDLREVDQLRLAFAEPPGFEVRFSGFADGTLSATAFRDGEPIDAAGMDAKIVRVLELAVPLGTLGCSPERRLEFFVELLYDQQSLDRVPHEGLFVMPCPHPDFELENWQA